MIDFSGLTAAIDGTAVAAAISAVAAIKILPRVARWGFSQVICWFSNDIPSGPSTGNPYENSYPNYESDSDLSDDEKLYYKTFFNDK